jgi:hypothetical protein
MWFKSQNKWKIHPLSHHLFTYFARTTSSSYRHEWHVPNKWSKVGLRLFHIFRESHRKQFMIEVTRYMNTSVCPVSYVIIPTHRHRVRSGDKVTREMNACTCHSTIIYSFQRKNSEMLLRWKSQDKWLVLGISPTNYLIPQKRRFLVRTFIENRLSMNNFTLLGSLVFKKTAHIYRLNSREWNHMTIE